MKWKVGIPRSPWTRGGIALAFLAGVESLLRKGA